MDIRHHSADGKKSQAVYSICGSYRYSLSRVWEETSGRLNFVMLNPSTANERHNDPTIERCERRSKSLGFGGFVVTNIFAWRATDPRELLKAPEPTGPENERMVLRTASQSDMVIVAWGVHGAHLHKGAETIERLQHAGLALYHLGLSKHGHPRHPLYVPYAQKPTLWQKPLS